MEILLPPKPKVDIPTGEHVEEVSMVEYSQTRGANNARHGAGAHSHGGASSFFRADASDDEDGEGGAQRVQCNTH